MRYRPSRWFLRWASGLMVFLGLSILLAGLLLLRQGFVLREGEVSGNSMEPHLRGPRLPWVCSRCSSRIEFGSESLRVRRPIVCPVCGQASDALDRESTLEFVPGETIQYAPLRMMRSQRSQAIKKGEADSSGLVRGDIVVVRENASSKKEIKRIVGFAGEHIAISDGDLWIDQTRWQKSLEQTLRQAILVDGWERDMNQGRTRIGAWTCNGLEFDGQSLADATLCFAVKKHAHIDNRIPTNAHDSHQIVAAQDIGVAIECVSLPSHGMLQCTLRNSLSESKVKITFDPERIIVATERNSTSVPRRPESVGVEDRMNHWIIVCRSDGNLLVGDTNDEWFRETIALPVGAFDDQPAYPDWEPTETSTDQNCPIAIQFVGVSASIQSLLVFRDIVYRGANDALEQQWEPTNGVVVLGDNVSMSFDSRERWPSRLRTSAVKGVVLESISPLEELLKQR